MTDDERVILLNQGVILTALAQILDRLNHKELAISCDDAAEKTQQWIKHNIDEQKEMEKL